LGGPLVGVSVSASAEGAKVDRLPDTSGVDACVGADGGDGAVLREADFAAVSGEQRVLVAAVLVNGAGVGDNEYWLCAFG